MARVSREICCGWWQFRCRGLAGRSPWRIGVGWTGRAVGSWASVLLLLPGGRSAGRPAGSNCNNNSMSRARAVAGGQSRPRELVRGPVARARELVTWDARLFIWWLLAWKGTMEGG